MLGIKASRATAIKERGVNLLSPRNREEEAIEIYYRNLIQYALAIDRVNEHVAYLYRPLHPAVLRLVRETVAGRAQVGVRPLGAAHAGRASLAEEGLRAGAVADDVDRVLLDRVHYHVYYDMRPGKVVVLAFWHASRGEQPKL